MVVSNITASGSPDFGKNVSTNPTSPSYDSGEDTTRLLMGGGSQARSGRWIYATGFEDGNLASIIQGSSLGFTGTETLDYTKSYQGAASLRMATQAVINTWSNFSKYVLPPGSRFGMEMMFCRTLTTPDFQHEFMIQMTYMGNPVLGLQRVIGSIKIIFVNSGNVKIYYRNPAIGFTLIQDITPYFTNLENLWHYIKFVVDVRTGQYVRLYFDDLLIDMSGFSAYTAGGVYPQLHFQTQLLTSTVNQQIYHIDNVVFTADEP